MNRTLIAVAMAALPLLASSCLEEPIGASRPDYSGYDVQVSYDDVGIDTRLFEVLDMSAPELAKAEKYRAEGSLYLSAKEILSYYRNRTSVQADLNLISPSISSEESEIASNALKANKYCFYVEGFEDAKTSKPYSYLSGGKLDWTLCASGDPEQTLRLGRLEWMPCQGLAYRCYHSESYASDWAEVYASWSEHKDTTDNWREEDAVVRSQSVITAWEYFLNSSSLTPQLASRILPDLSADLCRLPSDSLSAQVLGRASRLFPELASSSKWAESYTSVANKGFKKEWFEALDLSKLPKVKAAYEKGDFQGAADELLKYWRYRSGVQNPNVDLSTVSASDNNRRWAEMALAENGYRFYVNYNSAYEDYDALLPYSYSDGKGGINWQYWPKKDQEQRYQLNRHQWMLPQARAYYVTKNEKYALNFMEVYLDWFRQNPRPEVKLDYGTYPENLPEAYRNDGWTWRPVDVAARLMDGCSIIEYYVGSESMTASFLLQYLYNLSDQAHHIIDNYSQTSNHLITEAQSVAMVGILFPELAGSESFISSGSTTLTKQIEAQYYSDGWLMDGDFHYHLSSIESFRSPLVMAQLNGKDGAFPKGYADGLRKMADVVLNMVYPNYSTVNMTDTRTSTWSKSVLKRNFTRYSDLFPDNQNYLWMATEGAQGTVPANWGASYPDCGYYVMRSGWKSSDVMMVLENATQSPSEKWHRQWDNGNFELYAGGRMLFQDSGCYTYTTGSNRSKYAASAAHNTLTLDGANMSTCRGELLASGTLSGTKTDYLVLQNPSYTGLTHRRTVFFVERSFFVIVDEASGSASGTLNLNFNLIPGTDSQVAVDAAQNGSHTAFASGVNMLVRTFSPNTISTSERTGFLSTAIDKSEARKAYSVDQTKSSEAPARYVTVVYLASDAASHTVAATLPSDWSASSVEAEVSVDAKKYTLKATF